MDREKVIEGLEQFKADLKPFFGNRADWERFDAGFALLKEQEAVVRCISCTFYRSDGQCALHGGRWKPEGFCSWAIRKEGR